MGCEGNSPGTKLLWSLTGRFWLYFKIRVYSFNSILILIRESLKFCFKKKCQQVILYEKPILRSCIKSEEMWYLYMYIYTVLLPMQKFSIKFKKLVGMKFKQTHILLLFLFNDKSLWTPSIMFAGVYCGSLSIYQHRISWFRSLLFLRKNKCATLIKWNLE